MNHVVTQQFLNGTECHIAAMIIQEHYRRYKFKCKIERLTLAAQ